MLKNPQIKFEGQNCKDYLFPKYPGKFFVQAQKLKQLKILKNYNPITAQAEAKNTNLNRQDYKQMKAEADYIKRIQDLKKKLERQIKKYNKQKKKNEQFVKNASLSLQNKSSMIKLEQICVNIRRQKQKSDYINIQNGQRKMFRSKQQVKNKYYVKGYLKNRSQLKRKYKTEGCQILQQKMKFIKKQPQFFTNRSQRLSNPQQMYYLPQIDDKQDTLLRKNKYEIISEIRYSLPSNMKKNIQKIKIAQSNPSISKFTPMKDYSPRYQSQKRRESSICLNLVQKHNSNKKIEKKRSAIQGMIREKQIQPFLKGWQYHQDRYYQQSDSIYLHQDVN